MLLAMLLCHPDEPVSTERLVDAPWGASPPKSAADNLRDCARAQPDRR
ncbi:hypothetical protein ACTMTI_53535 [Nonomuraea sp. H19]